MINTPLTCDTRLAGVCFNNDLADGGESRQEILSRLYGQGPIVANLLHTKFFNEETGINEDAIKVLIPAIGNKCVGWIPRVDIEAMWKYPQMILLVNYYKETYSGMLFKCEAPTAKQYSIMKAKLRKGEVAHLPPYDKMCYRYAIASKAKVNA